MWMIGSFWPEWTLAPLLYVAFQFVSIEIYRALLLGVPDRGTDALANFVTGTAIVVTIFGYAWLAAYGYDFGWLSVIGLYVVTWLVIGMAMVVRGAIFMSVFKRGDLLTVWVLATLLVWPLMLFLSPTVTWFGFFG